MAYPLSPCTDLGDTEEHWVYRLLSTSATRRGVVNLNTGELSGQLHTGYVRVRDALGTLSDMGLVEPLGPGAWRVAEKCPHQQILPEGESFSSSFCKKTSGEARLEGGSPKDDRASTQVVMGIGVGGGSGGNQEKIPATVGYLAKYYFPQQVRANMPGKLGIHSEGALMGRMVAWKKQGHDVATIQRMIDIFCGYPEWVVRRAAWRVFISRADQLLQMVQESPETALTGSVSRSGGGKMQERLRGQLGLQRAVGA